MDERIERQLEARRMMVEAINYQADSYEGWEGALVTGYVCVFELTAPSGHQTVAWLTGNGAEPRAGQVEPLYEWRTEGLLRKALRDINQENVSRE
jgi:hypothetical protein